MDNDLERSVRLLEDALSTSGRGLFRKKSREYSKRNLNVSVSMGPLEYKQLLLNEGLSIYDETVTRFLQGDLTVTGSVLQANNLPWKTTLDSLNTEFFEVLQVHSGKYIFNVFYFYITY